jgi:hypothetical protein
MAEAAVCSKTMTYGAGASLPASMQPRPMSKKTGKRLRTLFAETRRREHAQKRVREFLECSRIEGVSCIEVVRRFS